MVKYRVPTPEERLAIVESTTYQCETCAGCAASEKNYFIEHGWSMLVWHPKPDMMLCENCYGDYPDDS